ncbi:type II toxin-antitoxin system VapC family toxin [Photorhabdus namnaonensis]|uniref:PIN domain protein n=1 Tax=Photorhabdus namnaonensis TaxID=1851568 RepID=A0A1B8YM72_9GAMM|nr:type II toxin-antitoxin system VapC family toxin [Photorhabdus namnaonensis]OCA56235.1 PIN domain protein [Photorhabdus namnaonensis]
MKRLLLDTHVFIWWLTNNSKLGPITRNILSRGANIVYVSAVTPWEISIKRSIGKLDFRADFEIAMEKNNFFPLPISHSHAEYAGDLPRYHSDPFDRMLIVQSQMEGLTLISADSIFSQYDIRLIDARM